MDFVPPEDLLAHRIRDTDAFYIPNFVTPDEEIYLIRKANLLNRGGSIWQIDGSSLQIWGGDITSKGTLIAQPLPPFVDKFPDLITRIKATGAFEHSPHQSPNHVIMNEYLPGQGIMPHEDGPKYHPVVATISLGSHAVFHYYQYCTESGDLSAASRGQGKSINMTPVLSVMLEPRSLIISSGATYTSHLHGIDGVEEDLFTDSTPGRDIANATLLQDTEILEAVRTRTSLKREVRYSLTCRDVARVSTLSASIRR